MSRVLCEVEIWRRMKPVIGMSLALFHPDADNN